LPPSPPRRAPAPAFGALDALAAAAALQPAAGRFDGLRLPSPGLPSPPGPDAGGCGSGSATKRRRLHPLTLDQLTLTARPPGGLFPLLADAGRPGPPAAAAADASEQGAPDGLRLESPVRKRAPPARARPAGALGSGIGGGKGPWMTAAAAAAAAALAATAVLSNRGGGSNSSSTGSASGSASSSSTGSGGSGCSSGSQHEWPPADCGAAAAVQDEPQDMDLDFDTALSPPRSALRPVWGAGSPGLGPFGGHGWGAPCSPEF
jgi:hypothetical protein